MTTNDTIERVAPSDLIPAEDNPRSHMEGKTLEEMAKSFASVGQLSPVKAYRGDNVLLYGHRRRAAALLGIEKGILPPDFTLEVIWIDRSTNGTGQVLTRAQRLVENVQRVDMDPIDEAQGYADLASLDLSRKEIAAQVGKSPTHVGNRLLLLELPPPQQAAVRKGDLSLTDAQRLGSLFAIDPEVGATVVSVGVTDWSLTRAENNLAQRKIILAAGAVADEANLTWVEREIDMPIPDGKVNQKRDKQFTNPSLTTLMRARADFAIISVNYKDEPVFTLVDFVDAATRRSEPVSDEEKARRRLEKARKAHRSEQFELIMANRHAAGPLDELLWNHTIGTVYGDTAKKMALLLLIEPLGEGPTKDWAGPVKAAWLEASTPAKSKMKVAYLLATAESSIGLSRAGNWYTTQHAILDHLGYVPFTDTEA